MLKSMKVIAFIATVAALSACSKNEASEQKKAEAPMEQMSKESSSVTTAQAVGVITAIDTKENILTLDHEAIPAIKWPAMTMGPIQLWGLSQKSSKHLKYFKMLTFHKI